MLDCGHWHARSTAGGAAVVSTLVDFADAVWSGETSNAFTPRSQDGTSDHSRTSANSRPSR